MKMGAWPALAPDMVRYVGDAVAVVIAETKHQARDAAEAVAVDLRGAAGRRRLRARQLRTARRSSIRRRRTM